MRFIIQNELTNENDVMQNNDNNGSNVVEIIGNCINYTFTEQFQSIFDIVRNGQLSLYYYFHHIH